MTRKSTLLATASVLAVVAAAPVSQAADIYTPVPMAEQAAPLPGVTGVLELWGGLGPLSSDDDSFDNDWVGTFGGEARAASYNWQLELNGGIIGPTDNSDSGDLSEHVALGAHWLSRGPAASWGLFGAVSGTGHQGESSSSVHLFGGGEYAWFHGNSTYFVQGGLIAGIAGEVSSSIGFGGFGRVGARYFMTPDSLFEADFTAILGEEGDSNGGTITAFNWSLEYEHRISGPFTGSLFYRGHYVEDPSNNAHDHIFGAQIAVDIGNINSLLERDRVGAATFDLPDMHRAFGWVDDL